jgi:Fic family protein
MIKELHFLIKLGTLDSSKDWFNVGKYKLLPNEVWGNKTCHPKEVANEMKKLLHDYHQLERKSLEDILNFHHRFEAIHPFQDGNGWVARKINHV